MSFDVSVLKKDFPLLSREESSEPLVYLDSAATSQKPQKGKTTYEFLFVTRRPFKNIYFRSCGVPSTHPRM